MIRIHVLLLASLLSIWGLTSCENSDTDKVNSYNLEVNLSQNEITAINGIISIKVSIKEFDQLAYLVINFLVFITIEQPKLIRNIRV